jgi:trimethylamine:corrinoid methyltransferase-like protein
MSVVQRFTTVLQEQSMVDTNELKYIHTHKKSVLNEIRYESRIQKNYAKITRNNAKLGRTQKRKEQNRTER